ncbi:hypothetical protein [Paraburkholderia sp. CI3]|uniref:hypothetical protein n=1 Tax=Paraburkholderia sp. CI3 TaxID=2991060 RepID=UPI003D24840A
MSSDFDSRVFRFILAVLIDKVSGEKNTLPKGGDASPASQVAARDKNDCQRKMQRPCLNVEMQGVRFKIAEASPQYGQQPR